MKIYLPVKGEFTLESKFTSAYLKVFKGDGWAFKIPDIIRTIKPLDWFGVNEGGAYFCEVKVIESNVFYFSNLRNNQYTALKRIYLLVEKYNLENIHPIVMIYSKRFQKYTVVKFSDILDAEKSGKDCLKFLF